jgi:hypothetical protein
MIANTVRYIIRYLSSYSRGCKRNLALATALSILFVLAAQAGALAQNACPPGLVHHFGLDEKESGSYTDYVTGASATCAGCPAPADSRFAGGQRFNGSSAGLLFNEIENFQWGPNSSFTIEMWVQTAGGSSGNQVLIGREAKDGDMAWWLGLDSDGYAILDMRDNLSGSHVIRDYLKAVKVNDGRWHHVALVRDGINETLKMYVDGLRVDDLRDPRKAFKGNLESASPVTIGYLDLGGMFRFNGTIDELMVYSRDLSDQEMRARYNRGAGNYCGPALVRPFIVSEAITYGAVGQNYVYDVNASGKPQPTYTLVSGPQGMTINATTGVIKWLPEAAGNFDVRVKASNSQGEDEQAFRISVKQGREDLADIRHHWMLNETSGSRFRDFYTPIDAIAETKSRPTAVKGAVGGGQRFNGRDTGLDVVGSPNFDWKADESFTIELWMRTETRTGNTENHNQVLIGRSAKDSPSQWWLGLDKDRRAAFYLPDTEMRGPYIGYAGPQLNDGAWHQLVAVRDGGTGATRLYVDGEEITAGRFVYENDFISRTPVNIGYFNASILNSYQYEGDLDEVKLFGRALSANEIKENYLEVYNGLTEFLSFEGRYTEGVVVLNWRTLNEINTDYFEVERSEDGENFSSIGQVKASGTTTAATDYTFTDETPLKEQGHYRLRMVRQDGTFVYSRTILVQDRSPVASSFRVYPNPAAGGQEVTIEVANLKENEEVTFTVTDVSGRQVLTQQVRTDEFGELHLTFPVGVSLRPGIYNLTVAGSNKTLNRKLVIAQ